MDLPLDWTGLRPLRPFCLNLTAGERSLHVPKRTIGGVHLRIGVARRVVVRWQGGRPVEPGTGALLPNGGASPLRPSLRSLPRRADSLHGPSAGDRSGPTTSTSGCSYQDAADRAMMGIAAATGSARRAPTIPP